MLAAALAASLADAAAQEQGPAPVAPATVEHPAVSAGSEQTASSEAELAHYYGSGGTGAAAPGFGEHGSKGQEAQQEQPLQRAASGGDAASGDAGSSAASADQVPSSCTSGSASQAVAGVHAGQEAAAVMQPCLEFAGALGGGADSPGADAAAAAPAKNPSPAS